MKKYSQDDLQIFTPEYTEKWLVEKPERVFRLGQPNAIEMIKGIVTDALVLNSTHIQITKANDWYIISSDIDWLKLGNSSTIDLLFDKIHAFPEAGPNSFRYEFLLKVFAHDVIIADSESVKVIKGELSEEVTEMISSLASEKKRLIAFRFLPNVQA
jgi:hypothetical protein